LFLWCVQFHDQLYFFYQAEDGIRDRNVTGVQTCALPILPDRLPDPAVSVSSFNILRTEYNLPGSPSSTPLLLLLLFIGFYIQERSEERRVGKEWRCMWWHRNDEQEKRTK